jgi:hypothetical protein
MLYACTYEAFVQQATRCEHLSKFDVYIDENTIQQIVKSKSLRCV